MLGILARARLCLSANRRATRHHAVSNGLAAVLAGKGGGSSDIGGKRSEQSLPPLCDPTHPLHLPLSAAMRLCRFSMALLQRSSCQGGRARLPSELLQHCFGLYVRSIAGTFHSLIRGVELPVNQCILGNRSRVKQCRRAQLCVCSPKSLPVWLSRRRRTWQCVCSRA